jgi:hypothetical protein
MREDPWPLLRDQGVTRAMVAGVGWIDHGDIDGFEKDERIAICPITY